MEDIHIIDLLFERSEEGLAGLGQKYKGLIMKILSGILPNPADTDECYNDLLLSVWNSIPPLRPRSLTAYICTLTRRIAINRYNYNHREKRNSQYALMLSELDEVIPDPTYGHESNSATILSVINTFLDDLDPASRVLFVRRYIYFESVTELAQRFEMSENAVSSRLFRTRNKLKKALRKENIDV